MCGRFTRFNPTERFASLFEADDDLESRPSYNIPPGSPILVARNRMDGSREMAWLKWGLVPAWSTEPKTAYSTINARAETVSEKPTFRSAFRQRRCLIAADGFYEWHRQPDSHKQPYFIHLVNHKPFAFAGIWEHWERDGRVLESCSILVTRANALMQPIHDRMPVILAPDQYDQWMDPRLTTLEPLQSCLSPFPPEAMAFHSVSSAVNSPRNDRSDLIEPLKT